MNIIDLLVVSPSEEKKKELDDNGISWNEHVVQLQKHLGYYVLIPTISIETDVMHERSNLCLDEDIFIQISFLCFSIIYKCNIN